MRKGNGGKRNADNYRDAGYKKTILTNADEYYKEFKNDAGVKFVENKSPIAKGLSVFDVSLSAKGPVEDRVYSDYGFYRENIRRGNTLATFEEKTYWLRKGLKKFFDIDITMVRGEKKGDNEHFATFRELENALSWNSSLEAEEDRAQVLVYKLLKANGENAQVSYFREVGCWVIASKNVCVLARNKDDLKQYTYERYHFAKLIALTWFDIIEKNTYSKEQLTALKNYMNNVTLIGEYCGSLVFYAGNPEYQHIVKYTYTTILFYALVEKEGRDSCIPLQEATRFFKEFNIPTVSGIGKEPDAKFNDYGKLCEYLAKLFEFVAGGKIEEEEEGCVVYFVLQAPAKFYQSAYENKLQDRFFIPEKAEPMNFRVVSLTKLKTLEYRIWRKLREKLKHFYSHIHQKQPADLKKEFTNLYGRYERETFELVGECKLQKPHQYYFLIGLRAFEYGIKYAKNLQAFELALNAYIDFLNVLMYCTEKGIEAKPEMTLDKYFIAKLRGVNWAEYNLKVEELYEKTLDELLPEYSKIKKLKGGQPLPKGEKGEEEEYEKE